MKQIYIEWRDAVGKSHHTGPEDDKPKSVRLKGTTWLVEEREIEIIVAAYYSDDDEGFMDMVASPKSSIEKREDVDDRPL